MTRHSVVAILSTLILLGGFGCGRNNNKSVNAEITGDTLTHESSLLSIVDCGEYTVADVVNPWDTATLLQRYVLIPRGKNVNKQSLPHGTVVEVPLSSSLVYSSVHSSVIKEIGSIDAVTGVCDAGYYKIPEIVAGIASGTIVDAGSSMSPSVEKIVSLDPDAILTSPFQNAGHGAIGQLGIPIVECADYMETTPLGRAEWIKLFGELYGCRAVADSIYRSVAGRYEELKQSVESIESSPMVISEMVLDGVWYMPGGHSYMARLFKDAGTSYPWNDDTSTGSLQLDFATVYERAHDADFWLIKTFGNDLTLKELQSSYPLHARMSAFGNGGVYACNTSSTTFFEDFPFHPDILLREYINIFHPGTITDSTLIYFKQVK